MPTARSSSAKKSGSKSRASAAKKKAGAKGRASSAKKPASKSRAPARRRTTTTRAPAAPMPAAEEVMGMEETMAGMPMGERKSEGM